MDLMFLRVSLTLAGEEYVQISPLIFIDVIG